MDIALRHSISKEARLAGELIDAGKYEEFEKMKFKNKDMEYHHIPELMVAVQSLKGLQYMEQKGLISDDVFSRKQIIFGASSEQIVFYIRHGAKVNDTIEVVNPKEERWEKFNFLDVVVLSDKYSPENVKSVINAGGKFKDNHLNLNGFEQTYSYEDVGRSFFGHSTDLYGDHYRKKTNCLSIKGMEKIEILDKAGMLSESDKKYLATRFSFNSNFMNSVSTEYSHEKDAQMEESLKRIEKNKGIIAERKGEKVSSPTEPTTHDSNSPTPTKPNGRGGGGRDDR